MRLGDCRIFIALKIDNVAKIFFALRTASEFSSFCSCVDDGDSSALIANRSASFAVFASKRVSRSARSARVA